MVGIELWLHERKGAIEDWSAEWGADPVAVAAILSECLSCNSWGPAITTNGLALLRKNEAVRVLAQLVDSGPPDGDTIDQWLGKLAFLDKSGIDQWLDSLAFLDEAKLY